MNSRSIERLQALSQDNKVSREKKRHTISTSSLYIGMYGLNTHTQHKHRNVMRSNVIYLL